ncbi:PQQ-dependent sugar dehydrogenase [Nocardia yamanashiensis]|uniref:PQQ-dependent sugar dehydrogenase n=1 Tax=Nocardia yamanashiensis TaxID=209247 RepID=UPI000830E8B5|nr:PQQ-dependent sugar dehydrogenase [Nocardia yamanashiensis]
MRTASVRVVTVLLLLLGVTAACAGEESTPVATFTAPSTPGREPDFNAGEQVAQGITTPWGLAFLPDGRALVAERDSGVVLRVSPGSGVEQVYRVPGVEATGEAGLLGLAVSPEYARDGLVYAYFTTAQDNRIVRFRLDGQPEVVFSGIAKGSIHDGGRIAFGPDGMLYAGTGDAGQGNRSQDFADPNGKILRLTPDGAAAPGNPVAGSPSGIAIAGDTLYMAALRGERLWTVPLRAGATGNPRALLADRYGRLRTVAIAPDGALWLTTSNTDGRGDERAGDDRIIRFPAR